MTRTQIEVVRPRGMGPGKAVLNHVGSRTQRHHSGIQILVPARKEVPYCSLGILRAIFFFLRPFFFNLLLNIFFPVTGKKAAELSLLVILIPCRLPDPLLVLCAEGDLFLHLPYPGFSPRFRRFISMLFIPFRHFLLHLFQRSRREHGGHHHFLEGVALPVL